MSLYICNRVCTSHALHTLFVAGIWVTVRHVEVKELCQATSGLVWVGKVSLFAPENTCTECISDVGVPVFSSHLCVLNLRKGSKVVKTMLLCLPFLLMINVWLFSEEKCLGIRAFKMHYFQALSIFRSCRHDIIMW